MSDAKGRENVTAVDEHRLEHEEGLEPARAGPLRLLHRQLRGRYRLTAILGASLAVVFGTATFRLVRPRYRSVGLIQVVPALPAVLYRSEENRTLPMFDSFVQALATMLQSRQVLDNAVRQLANTDWPPGVEGARHLERSLDVRHKRGEQVISVSVSHVDAELARAAVNALLMAFVHKHNADEARMRDRREARLVARERELRESLRTVERTILDVTAHAGPDALARGYAARVAEVEALERRLAELDRAERRLERAGGDEDTAALLAELSAGPGAGQPAAAGDPVLANLRQRELGLELELEERRHRFRPAHPLMLTLQRRLEAVRGQIRRREGTVGAPAPEAATAERLARLRGLWTTRLDAWREEAEALGRRAMETSALQAEATSLEARLQATRQRLDELRVEGGPDSNARLSIASEGYLPSVPETDKRLRAAAVAALLGLVASVGAVYAAGRLDHRVRYADDLDPWREQAPLLGVIPDLGDGGEAVQLEAALAFHQLRNLLETISGASGERVFAVAGPSAGDGKTCVSLALASSFAAVGLRTLIVDVDLAGQGITRRLGLVDRAGLRQALEDLETFGAVHVTDTPDLWAVPTGNRRDRRLDPIAPGRLHELIALLARRFDVLVIDTGPVLESLEATLVAGAGARFLLVACRGRRLGHLNLALERLRQAGARCAGLVLNRAGPEDCREIEALTCRTISCPVPGRGRGDEGSVLDVIPHVRVEGDGAPASGRSKGTVEV